MFFSIDPSNGIAIYEQIVRQVKFAVADGVLIPGQLLPSVRTLSVQLAINPNTIAKAFQILQSEGVCEALRGRGLAIRSDAVAACDRARRTLLEERLRSAILAEYRKILANIPHWVLALRSRHTIEDCDSAEKIELVALTHCLGDGAARRLGNEVYTSLAKLLSDDRSRDQVRKVALASTWWASQRFSKSNRDASMELGSYNMSYLLNDSDFQLSKRDGYIPSSIELRRARDLLVGDLWSLLELSPENVQAMTENQHPIGKFSRRALWGLTDLVDGVLNLRSRGPASAWRGAWESIAKQLPPEVSDHE